MSLRKQIISGSAWVLSGRVGGALVGLVFYSLLTRVLSAEDVGTYFLAFSVATALTAVVGLGLPRTATRLLAEITSGALSNTMIGVVWRSLVLTLFAGAVVASLYVALLGEWLAQSFFDSPRFASIDGYVAVWFVLLALRQLLAESFRGLGNIKFASLFGGFVSGAIASALLAGSGLLFGLADLGLALTYTLLGLLVSTGLAFMLLSRETASASSGSGIGIAQILVISGPIMLTEIVQVILAQSNIWILGAISTETQVALYGTVMQIVLLVSFPFVIVNNAIPQLLVKFKIAGQQDKLERLLQGVATATFVPALLLVAGLAFFGRPLLELVYGDSYGAGAVALIWLAAGQLVNVSAGPCGIALILTGHQHISLAVNVATGFVAIPLAIYLSTLYGAAGAAASAAIAMGAQNIVLAIFAKRRIGVRTHISFSKRIISQFSLGERP